MSGQKLFGSLTLFCLLMLAGCDDDTPTTSPLHQVTFNNLGLQGKIVNELDLVQNHLWASTDMGLFVKDLSAQNGTWLAKGLDQKNVKTFIALNPNLYLASTANPGQAEFILYKSTDGGQNWQALDSNWGGGNPETLNDLAWDEANEELWGVGLGVVAKSEDAGQHWTVARGDWDYMATGLAFVAINPENGDVWAGGQNAIEGFTLHRQNSATGSWQSWENLIPSPSVGKSIAFGRSEPQPILIGSEDGILRTLDHGSSWSTVKHDQLSSARFYFGLEFDHEMNNRIYAASWDKEFDNPQPILLHISNDEGTSWHQYQHNSNGLYGGVWSMTQKSDGPKTRLYLGLFKGGVYEAVIDDTAMLE